MISCVCFSQSKRISHWYFGYKAGLDFNTGSPTVDLSGNIHAFEGCATMSDESGQLLFYTNGIRVWNRDHTVMPNGNIMGNPSSTQSTLIVPLPGSNDLYYLFSSLATVSGRHPGLYYNIIDMRLNAGLGDITASKDVPIMVKGTEQLAGTMHCNATDYWIAGRQYHEDSLKFYVWRLTKNGLSAPVISSFYAPNRNSYGSITFSQDGRMMVLSALGLPHYQVDIYQFDFDNRTGLISMKNRIGLKQGEGVYANAISPDKKRLYVSIAQLSGFQQSVHHHLAQFDLTAGNISASRVDLDSFPVGNSTLGNFGQIRLGPDQRMYISRYRLDLSRPVDPNTDLAVDSLDVIHFPNMPGISCQYQKNYLYLKQPTGLGLPNFISNYTLPVPPAGDCAFKPGTFDFNLDNECNGRDIRFRYTIPVDADSIKWDFGDPASGSDNLSVLPDPLHKYPHDGDYTATLTIFHDYGADTVLQKNVMVRKRYCDLFMPSAFSPNGDGVNDVFRLIHGDHITRFNMEIFNRWGQKIFSSANIKEGWNGLYQGIPQPSGLYIWNIVYDTRHIKNQRLRGILTLVK